MTALPALCVSTEVGASVVEGVIIGLGDLDLTCPTCRGFSGQTFDVVHRPEGRRAEHVDMTIECSDCTDGQRVPVSGLHAVVVDGVILWYAHIEYLPVYEGLSGPTDRAHVVINPAGDSAWLHKTIPKGEVEVLSDVVDITDAATGPLVPGGWAAHVTQISDTIPCQHEAITMLHRRSCKLPLHPPTVPHSYLMGWTPEQWEHRGRGADETLRLPLPWSSAPDRPPYITTLDLNTLGAS